MQTVQALLSGFVVLSVAWFALQPSSLSLFSWHPFCMTLAVVGTLPWAISRFQQPSGQGTPNRTDRTWSHFRLMAFTALLMAIGHYAIYATKEAYGKPHLTSWHGLLGAIASILIIMQTFSNSAFLYPERIKDMVAKIGGFKVAYRVHRLMGMTTFSLATTALFLGFYSNWWTGVAAGWLWPAVALASAGVYALLAAGFLRLTA
eukprot:m.62932 g.62932  ORF g.62932 m.62932 type:complete len:204 (+) comp13817_c0_seq2:35-646(+)